MVRIATMPTSPAQRDFRQQLSRQLTSQTPPPSLFIHVPHNTPLILPLIQSTIASRRTTAISDDSSPPEIQDVLPRVAVVDLGEVYSVRTAFDQILNQLSGWTAIGTAPVWTEADGKVANWDSRNTGWEVVRNLRKRKIRVGHSGPRKRMRVDVEEMDEEEDDLEVLPQDQFLKGISDSGSDNEEEDSWSLEWNRTSATPIEEVSFIKDSLDHFHDSLKSVFSLGNNEAAAHLAVPTRKFPASARRFIVFLEGERLYDLASAGNVGGAPKETGLGMTFAASIQRLNELTALPLTIITISRIGWEKARESMIGLKDPTILTFPSLDQQDVISILSDRFVPHAPISPILDPSGVITLFGALVSLVHKTFGGLIHNDLEELAHLVLQFWPKWLACVERGNPPISPTDIARLAGQLKEDLAKERERFSIPRFHSSTNTLVDATSSQIVLQGFTGSMPSLPSAPSTPSPFASTSTSPSHSTFASPSTSQFSGLPTLSLREQSNLQIAESHRSSPSKTHAIASDQSLSRSLPDISKWLLLASFYAGFNPPKSDVRHFVRLDENIAKKGKKPRKLTAPKPGSPIKSSLRAELGGGKAFPLERMLAIFEAIVEKEYDYAAQSVDVSMQVSTLINLRLIQKISAQDKFTDGIKLKCKLSKETVDMLAKSVGRPEWKELLWASEN